MEKIGGFLFEHWKLVLIINVVAIAFIIGYIIESKEKKQKRKNDNDDKIIFDNEEPIIDNLNENIMTTNPEPILQDENKNTIEKETINTKKKSEDEIILDKIKKRNMENINEISNENNKKINIQKIIDDENSILNEFNKVIPNKKIIDDEIKEELENFKTKIEPIKKHKKNSYIDTNIDLPEISLSKDKEDLWD